MTGMFLTTIGFAFKVTAHGNNCGGNNHDLCFYVHNTLFKTTTTTSGGDAIIVKTSACNKYPNPGPALGPGERGPLGTSGWSWGTGKPDLCSGTETPIVLITNQTTSKQIKLTLVPINTAPEGISEIKINCTKWSSDSLP